MTFTDACGNENGEEITVDVYPIPAALVTEDVTIENPAEVSLNATGDNLLWYENEDDILPFGAGPDVPVYVGATRPSGSKVNPPIPARWARAPSPSATRRTASTTPTPGSGGMMPTRA